LANFYEQCEKIKTNTDQETENYIDHLKSSETSNKATILKSIDSNIKSNSKGQSPSQPPTLLYNPNKRKAPIALNNNTNNGMTRVCSPVNENQANNSNVNKENNDNNLSKVLTGIEPDAKKAANDVVLICNSLKVNK